MVEWKRIAWLVPCLLIAACSTIETPDLAADVQREGIMPERWQPLEMRVGLAPMRVNLELDERRYNVDGTQRWVLAPEPARLNGPDGLNARMLDVMREYKLFQAVDYVSGVSPETPRADLLELALRQGFDVVVVPTVTRRDVGHVASNGAYGWNMFVWWMVSPLFSWYIADEDFDANLHIELRIFPVVQDAELAGTKLAPREPVVRSLDDFDHGFNFFSIYSTPGYMGADNWQKVGSRMLPIAENEAQKALLRYVTTDLAEKSRQDAFRARMRRRVAVVIGVDGNGAPPVPLSRYAVNDASTLAVHFSECTHDPVPNLSLRTLTGPRATRRAIEQAAEELAPLARPNDDLLVAFCGVGALDDKLRPALVLSQTPGQKLELIALEDLIALFTVNRPRTLTLILDCAFTSTTGRGAARADQLAQLTGGTNMLEAVAKRVESAGTACIILAASDGVAANPHGMKALEIEELGQGLFTAFALEALSGKADSDRNRQVSVNEFQAYVSERVGRVAELEGESQRGYFRIPASRIGYSLPSMR